MGDCAADFRVSHVTITTSNLGLIIASRWNEWDNMMSSVSALGNSNELGSLSIDGR